MSSLRFVLVRPKDPRNIGSSARAMKNFGLHDLWLVAPQQLLTAEAFALAVHAQDVLKGAVRCTTVAEAVGDRTLVLGTTARARVATKETYTPRQAADILRGHDAAILFGPEDYGLSNEDLDTCQGYIRIPTADYASLNLAHAVQIIAYECFLSSWEEPLKPVQEELAARAAVESMYAHLFETLHLIGFTDAMRERIAINYFRDLFDRLDLTTKDVTILRGLWRQVQWAAKDELKRRQSGAP